MKGNTMHTYRSAIFVAGMLSTVAFAKPETGGGSNAAPPAPPAPAANRVTVTEVSTAFALPASGRGGGPSPYKFDDLAAPTVVDGKQVLASFGVVGKTKKNMNSTVFSANKKHRTLLFNEDGSKKMVTKTVKGQPVLEQAFTQDRKFEAFDVKEDGGVTVRIFRTK
jgi:hypothetical protein